MRLGVDLSILRHPHAGSARYAVGLVRALEQVAPDIELLPWPGPRRWRLGGPLRKVANLVRERRWYEVDIPRLARAHHVDGLLMPVNLSARRGAVPQLVTIHDVNFLSVPGAYDRAYAAYARRAFARAVRDADRLTTDSAYSRAEIVRHLGASAEKITVVYPGLDPAPAGVAQPSPTGAPYALYVGATEPHKNLGMLFEAWRAGPPGGLQLAIVGQPGRDHERLTRMARAIGPAVRLVGRVDQAELERWYGSAAVFVFPSRTEGFGFPPLEAMQRGIPVIAARAGALPEVLGDAALFHDPEDVEALRGLVEGVTRDATVREALAARGQRQAARYTWTAAAERIAELLRGMVEMAAADAPH